MADNVLTWVQRLSRWVNITDCSLEAVRFDTQSLENPNIKGEEYQHSTLFGYEIREYLLEKFGHTCQYCGGESGDPVLEWEHIHPKSRVDPTG
ncbi:MAG: RRXRR domain-containing protein [Lachnospiraceae bacterium]